MRPDGSGEKMNGTPAKDVTDAVLASVDLDKEPAAVNVSGEITEYASTCAVPIVHRAGEVATETHATSHWWKNLGQETVVLLSADLFPIAAADHHMM